MVDTTPVTNQIRDALNALNDALVPNGYYLFLNLHYEGNLLIFSSTTEVDYIASMIPPPPDGSQATLIKLPSR